MALLNKAIQFLDPPQTFRVLPPAEFQRNPPRRFCAILHTNQSTNTQPSQQIACNPKYLNVLFNHLLVFLNSPLRLRVIDAQGALNIKTRYRAVGTLPNFWKSDCENNFPSARRTSWPGLLGENSAFGRSAVTLDRVMCTHDFKQEIDSQVTTQGAQPDMYCTVHH